tara:strand:+ start:839 stop:1951 length:1113 start_codon:yes stop_codon:yes gene_type:complete
MKYCKLCVLPDTKPGLTINKEGVCSACESLQTKFLIDWDKREKQLSNLCHSIKSNKKSPYDCIVPVSGGKDSNTQVFVMSELYKLRVLAVVITPHVQTSEGIENLNSLVEKHNVDLLKINVKPSVLQKIRRNAFLKIGNPNYAEHRVVFSSVARASIFYNIPLVVWGEDIASEFGGNLSKESEKEGSAQDLISNDLFREAEFHELLDKSITNKDLFFYNHPDIKELKEKSIKSIYLSHFQWWDGIKHYHISKQFGFTERRAGPLSGNIVAYDNIDEKLCEIHKWLQFMKFGFWRPHDEACYKIWNGYMTREEAVEKVNAVKYNFPSEYLEEFLEYHELTEKDFNNCLEKWRNPNIWENVNGDWRLKYELK